jgi:GNAT superfamily N-acetyltransferase
MVSELKLRPVVHHGSAEQIFPGDEREDDEGYSFRHIQGRQQVAHLTSELGALPRLNDRWPFDVWLDRAADHDSTIIEVRREGEPTPAGFAIVNTELELEADQKMLVLHLDLSSVYVTPSRRGQGHSQALSWAIGEHVDQILSALSHVPEESRTFLKDHKVEIFISGEAHSEGGAHFLAEAVEQIESNMEFVDLKNAWFEVPTVIDDVNLDKFSRLAKMR